MNHLVEKEKLVLSVEQEILRVHGRAARALANQPLPYSVCTFMRDENVYTPIDPCQEEKNRDIRSRYNGRLFLSWLQDVDDKWEKNKGANGIAASQRGGEPECCAEDGLGVETAGDQLGDQGEAGHRRPPRAHGPGQRRLRPAGLLKSQLPINCQCYPLPLPPNPIYSFS